MGIVFRQSAKNAIIVLAGAFLGALILWLQAQYIPNKHQLGFTQDLIVYTVTFSQLLLVGLNTTLAVYIHRLSDKEEKRKLLITLCVAIPVILTGIGTVFYFLFSSGIINYFTEEDRPIIRQYFSLFPIFTLLFIFQLLMEQYLASQMKVAVAAFTREIVLRLINIVLLILFAYGHISFEILVIGTVLMYLIPVSLLLILSVKTSAFGLNFNLRDFNRSEYLDMAKFSWYHLLLSVSIMFMGYMDLMLLPHYDKSGLGAVAVYRYAVFLIVILQMPSKALTPASFTSLAQAYTNNEMNRTRDLFTRSSINIFIPTICMAILIFCNLNNAVAIIRNNYSAMIPLFSILFIGSIINIATGMNDQVLSIANYYKFNFYLALFLITILYFLLRFMIPRYGIYGAAWSNTITLMLFNIIKYLFIKKKLGMVPFTSKTLLVIVAGIPALAAGYFFPYLFEPARHIYVHTFLDVIMRSTVIVIVYLLMLLWLKPSDDLVEYIASIKKNKRLY